MKRTYYILLLAFIATACNPDSESVQNRIQLDECELTIRVLGSEVDLDSIDIWIDTAPIFINTFENETYRLIRKDSAFVGRIPTELKEEVVGLTIETNRSESGRLLQLRQGENNVYDIIINSGLRPDWGDKPDFEGLTFADWQKIISGSHPFFGSHDLNTPTEKYADWQEVRAYENDTLWPRNLALANLPSDLPNWVINSLRCRFASVVSLPYKKNAPQILNVDEPPMESYTFLDSISYSPDDFLKKIPYTGLKGFLYALLRFPEGGFEPIGETPVDQWQEKANMKLSRAIHHPTRLLLDLLSAMSFVEQIDIKHQVLSERQIKNIKSGYTDGLKDIILNKNEKLIALQTAKIGNVKDLVGEKFSIKEYIDKEYHDKPVIVDMWGTWCMPCMAAIAKSETIRKDLDTKDVVFLYIVTETTPLKAWKDNIPMISGDHIRIDNEATEEIAKKYNSTGFPTYLFFNASHDLVASYIGFPGVKNYVDMIKTISDR